MAKPYLSVVIPCYNEVANLQRNVLAQVAKYLSAKKFTWEVIISDDGSSDQSRELIRKHIKTLKNFRLLVNNHGGKPTALWHGVKNSMGKFILFVDMDQSTPIKELDKLLPYAEQGYKVVIGSRGLERKNFPLYRRLGSFVFLTLRKSVVLPEISDTQCGFKLFDKEVLVTSFPRLEYFKKSRERAGWKVSSYDVELLYIIKNMGHQIKEVIVDWQDRDVSKSKGGGVNRYFKESWDMLGQILRVKLNDLKGLY